MSSCSTPGKTFKHFILLLDTSGPAAYIFDDGFSFPPGDYRVKLLS